MIKNRVKKRKLNNLERTALKATRWIGSPESLIFHTVCFVGAFVLVSFGIPFERVLLVLTTIVSLEAIYLSIFIQMAVNQQARRLHAVSKDIDEIQEDVEEIQEDIDEIQKDVDEIQEDVEDIGEDIEEIQEDVEEDDKRDLEILTEHKTRVEKIEEALKGVVQKATGKGKKSS